MHILEINNLTKSYGSIVAVNNLSLNVAKGNIFGFLGPNGSGKTTTLGIILDILKADSGSYTWFENNYDGNPRRKIGAILEAPNFYPFMTGQQNLDIVAHIKKVSHPRYEEILNLVNLEHRKDHHFKTYSLGMKQRLAIAAALIGDPEVLIFDEPTNGLDPQGIAEVRNTILEIANQGKTIIVASHILAEVEKVCSHVAIIKNGNLLAQGTVGAILSSDVEVEIASPDQSKLKELLVNHPQVKSISNKANMLVLTVEEDFSAGDISLLAAQNGIGITHLLAKKRSLEEEFLEITKES